jgi:hypothetical protein
LTCGAFSAVIQSTPSALSASRLALVTIPRSLANTTCPRAKRPVSFPIWEGSVLSSCKDPLEHLGRDRTAIPVAE